MAGLRPTVVEIFTAGGRGRGGDYLPPWGYQVLRLAHRPADINFDVPRGRITCILGPSETGKSVLLKNIIGLLTPERGEIWVDGDQVVGMGEKDLYRVRRKSGVLFQDGALFGSMNLFDNIAFPRREHQEGRPKDSGNRPGKGGIRRPSRPPEEGAR